MPNQIDTKRAKACQKIIERCSLSAAALALINVPNREVEAMLQIHIGMTTALFQIHERFVDDQEAADLLTRIGAVVGFSIIGMPQASAAARILLPGIGGVMSAPFLNSITQGVAAAVMLVIQEETPDQQLENAAIQAAYRGAFEDAKKDFEKAKTDNREVQRLAKIAANVSSQKISRDFLDSETQAEISPIAIQKIIDKILPKAFREAFIDAVINESDVNDYQYRLNVLHARNYIELQQKKAALAALAESKS